MVDRQIHSVQQAEDDQSEPSPVPDADQRHGDESRRNARLKGRPRIKPSDLEPTNEPKAPDKRRTRRRRGKIRSRVAIEDRVIRAEVPPGSRFNGHESYVVQDVAHDETGGERTAGVAQFR